MVSTCSIVFVLRSNAVGSDEREYNTIHFSEWKEVD